MGRGQYVYANTFILTTQVMMTMNAAKKLMTLLLVML